jgi:DNA-binding LacI/PurR family transcriptional regulator
MGSVIQQIADELNVSNASVSRALNDRPGVSEDLRARILQRARELDYQPNITARALATSQTFSIGFFVAEKPGLSTHTDPFYGEILHGVEQASGSSDYHITIGTLSREILESPKDFRFTREKRVDGMILAGPDIPASFILAMQGTDLPVVLVDNRLEHSGINCVNSDDEHGAFLAAQKLITLGHRFIGIIAGPEEWPSNARRVAGYCRALGATAQAHVIVHMDRTTIDSGTEAYTQLSQQYPELTAICAVNDSMAIGAIRAAAERDQNVPDDLSVVGFDDIAWAKLNDPPLTTVRVPKAQMGREAFHRLMSLLRDPAMQPVEITVGVELIDRNSTKPL